MPDKMDKKCIGQNDKQTRLYLFFLFCVPLRVTFAFLLLTESIFWKVCFSAILMYYSGRFFVKWRKQTEQDRGMFNGAVWWRRDVHGFLFFVAAVCIFIGLFEDTVRIEYAVAILVGDVFFGVVHRLSFDCDPYIVFGYSLFGVVAVVSAYHAYDANHWTALLTNGAIGLTAYYAYTAKRKDLAIIGVVLMSASLVWHSSARYRLFDHFVSRYMAYYSFATTTFEPVIIGPPALFLSVLFTYYGDFNEMYMVVPIVATILIFKLIRRTITPRIAVAVCLSPLALYAKAITEWHSAWHVLASIIVALLCTETPKATKTPKAPKAPTAPNVLIPNALVVPVVPVVPVEKNKIRFL